MLCVLEASDHCAMQDAHSRWLHWVFTGVKRRSWQIWSLLVRIRVFAGGTYGAEVIVRDLFRVRWCCCFGHDAQVMRRGEQKEDQVIPVGGQTLAAVPWCIGGMARVVMLLSSLVKASSRHQSAPHELRRGGTSRDSASKLRIIFFHLQGSLIMCTTM